MPENEYTIEQILAMSHDDFERYTGDLQSTLSKDLHSEWKGFRRRFRDEELKLQREFSDVQKDLARQINRWNEDRKKAASDE